jgi:hypothetical protein
VTTVFYTFTMAMEGDLTYHAIPRAGAQFAVREVATAKGNEWRLVEWRDGRVPLSSSLQSSTATEATTWGAIKTLYGSSS